MGYLKMTHNDALGQERVNFSYLVYNIGKFIMEIAKRIVMNEVLW